MSSAPFNTGTGWVDQVAFTPGTTSPLVLSWTGNRTVPAGSDFRMSVSAGGTPPLRYQWRVSGTNIPGATTSSLALSNVQASAAGTYEVSMTNSYGATNRTATLTITASAPSFITQPSTREMVPGVTVTFTGVARGSEPLHYQWQFNGVDLPGEESPSVILPNVQTNLAGAYRVVVSNDYGSTNSSSASLIIVPMVIVGWGDNFFGEITVPFGLTNVTALGCGWDFSLAANQGQPPVDWGFPVSDFPTNITSVVAIAGGQSHAIALGSDGAVTTVGGGPYPSPALTNVVQVGAGDFFHSVALQSDGRVFAWGGGNVSLQTNVPPDLTNAIAVFGGWRHDLAIRGDGTVVAWGVDSSGSTKIPAGLTGVVAVAAGWDHSLALQANGTVVAWGFNGYGQTNVPAGLSNVVAISGGQFDSIALKYDGTVVAWGGGFSDQTNIPAWLKQVVAIASGQDHHLALLTDGSPFFTRQPYSQTILSGATVAFNPVVLGQAPFAFQWKFNGTDIPGATNLSLTLSNTPSSASGRYWCTASNGSKVAISLPAYLTVLRSRPRFISSPSGIQFTNGVLTLQLTGCSGHGNLIVYGSPDLRTWSPLLTNPPVVGDVTVWDVFATNYIRRFYRVGEE